MTFLAMYIMASVRNIIDQLEEIVFFVIHISVEIIMILSSFYVQPLIIPSLGIGIMVLDGYV
jgi:hypothetical protein